MKRDPANEATGVVPILREPTTIRGATLKPTLVCVGGPDMGQSFRISSTHEIGRSGCDITLTDRDVSRHHALFGCGAGGYEVEDLGSTNGTFVNGRRISQRVSVEVGDRLQVGNSIFLFTIQDELEQRVSSIVRLEAMATLAGGIAHDFNNALSVVLCNLDYVGTVLPASNADARQAVEEMARAASSAASLARQLLQLGRSDNEPFAPVSISDVVAQAIAMVRRRSKNRIVTSTNVPSQLRVLGSADDLLHVLLNLSYNACDAMPSGGRLAIEARLVRLDQAAALRCQLHIPGDYIEVAVSDTGHGMDERTLERAFDPFFTTKPRGEGTGLGLAMVHAAVRRHGGAVEASSSPGNGTTFRILLPVSPAQETSPSMRA